MGGLAIAEMLVANKTITNIKLVAFAEIVFRAQFLPYHVILSIQMCSCLLHNLSFWGTISFSAVCICICVCMCIGVIIVADDDVVVFPVHVSTVCK